MKKLGLFVALLGLIASPALADIVDGTFETTSFVTDTSPQVDENPHRWTGGASGAPALCEIKAAGGVGDSGYLHMSAKFNSCAGQWFQVTGLTAGTAYQLQFDMMVVGDDNNSNNTFKVTMVENNGTENYKSRMLGSSIWSAKYPSDVDVDVDNEAFDITSAMGWTTHTTSGAITFDGSDGYLFVGFAAHAVRSDQGGYIGIDNVQLVPEPMTMSLLAFGGLGMLIRRKRK